MPMIEECKITTKAMLKFYGGKIHGIAVLALFSGVCKVNTAIATQILIDVYSADIVINAGTAGGMSKELEIFDSETAYRSFLSDVLPILQRTAETNVLKKTVKRLLG